MLVKGEEVVGFAFVASVEASAAGEPGHGAFDGPAVTAQPLRGLDALAGDAVGDAPVAQPSPQMRVVVALVGVEFARLASPGPAAGADRRYALHQRDQGLTVVQVRRDPDGDGQTGPLGDQVDLRAVLDPADRIRTRQVPLFRARMFTESIAQRDQSSSPWDPSSSRTRR